MIAMSITWPRPVARDACSAAITAKLVASAAMPSASPNGGSVGGPSGSPVSAAKPLIASASEPKPGRRAYGPDLAERGDAGDHEARVALRGAVRTEAPALERAGPEVLDQHVGFVDETAAGPRRRAASDRSSVDRALVAAERLPPQVDAVLRGSVAAGGVGPRRVLDLDDVGAEVAEERRGQRPGEQRRRVDDAEAGERCVSHRRLLHRSRSQASRKPMRGSASSPSPASSSLALNDGSRGPPSTYQSEPGASCVAAALEHHEAGDAVGVLALGPVPHQRVAGAGTPGPSPASCHSNSVGSRAPRQAAYARASSRSTNVIGASPVPGRDAVVQCAANRFAPAGW